MNKYDELKKKQSKDLEKFPFIFAFSDKELEESLKKVGLTKNDKDKIVDFESGIFMKKDDFEKYKEINVKHKNELQNEINKDITGEGFIKDMFLSELNNHEYGYTHEIDETLDYLNLTDEDIKNNRSLRTGLILAEKEILEREEIEEEEI